MRRMFLLFFLMEICILFTSSGYCLDYTVSFSAIGVSNSIDSVTVTNLNKGSSVLVPANSKLHLTDITTSNKQILDIKKNEIVAYNSLNTSTVTFNALLDGTTSTYVYDVSGRLILENSSYLYSGYHSFEISLSSGLYFIRIIGNNYKYSLKIINQNIGKIQPRIVIKDEPNTNKTSKKIITESKVNMLYSAGDRLIFRACSGNNKTLLSDIPTADKNIEFQFSECKDPEGRHYVTTKIGGQIWMAENYAYLPYVNNYKEDDKTSFAISDVYNYMYFYVIDYNGHNIDSAKNASYYKKYGACYNLAAALNSAPTGWHLPTIEEWNTLKNYLIENGFGVGGSGNDIAKSLSANYGWYKNQTAYYIAENQATQNNSSCFSALPGGQKTTGTGTYGNEERWWTASYNSTTTCVDRDNNPTQCIPYFYCMQISNYRVDKDLVKISNEHYKPINVRYIKNIE